jgi:hypothetical protein
MSSKLLLYFFTLLLTSLGLRAQQDSVPAINDSKFTGYITLAGFAHSNDDLPFWLYTNTNATINANSDVRLRTGISREFQFKNNDTLSIGAGLNVSDGFSSKVQIEELYASYTKRWLHIIAGVKHNDVPYDGLSVINGSILWTGNARSIPGVQLKTSKPIKINDWFSFTLSLAHYELNDDRFVAGAKIHHKSLHVGFKLSANSNISIGLEHYVQWGGVSPEFGQQAQSLKDYIKLALGQSGGNTRNDQINSLGNHLGSYQLKYFLKTNKLNYTLYHQTLFEDTSGRELSNFPDGVWGIVLQPKESSYINSILFEYVQTVSQSGSPREVEGENQQSGADNYFGNGIYQSGWTYQNAVIGLPFILRNVTNTFVINNRTYALHAGAAGSYNRFDYSLKSSLVKNLGTYGQRYEPAEKAIYLYGSLSYNSNYGIFKVLSGLDMSNIQTSTVGASVGYEYRFK